MFHEKRVPTDAISIVLEAAKQRDFTGVEAVDAAIEIVGCGNAFRGESVGPFGAAPPADEIQSEDDAVAAAESYEGEAGFGAAGDHEEAEAIPPVVISIALFFLRRLAEKWLNR